MINKAFRALFFYKRNGRSKLPLINNHFIYGDIEKSFPKEEEPSLRAK